MTCCVQQCPGGSNFVSFPKLDRFRQRWQEAIKIGSGTTIVLPPGKNAPFEQQICTSHFPNPDELVYQEPTRFIDRTGQIREVESCRLCLRFQPKPAMLAIDEQLAGHNIGSLIATALKIRLKPYDFLQHICHECLVKIDLVRAVQSQYVLRDVQYRTLELMKIPFIPVKSVLPDTRHDVSLDIKPVVSPETMEVETSDQSIKLEPEVTIEESNLVEQLKPKKPKRTMDKPRKKYKKRGQNPVKIIPKEDRLRSINARTCYICSTKVLFDSTDELHKHLTEVHAGQIDYVCVHCDGKRFAVVSGYNNHLCLHDVSERPLKCNFCALRYSTKKGLQVHENKLHGANHQLPKLCISKRMKPQCEHCGKFFPSIMRAREHKLVVHENGVVAECKICLKTFVTTANLRRHMLVHSKERPYACNICGIRFRVSTYLTKHILADHQGKSAYHCKVCDIPFRNQSEYYRHRNKLHLKPNVRLYRCRLCSEVPVTSKDLEAHIEVCHPGGDYPYKRCTQCDEKFVTNMKLGVHLRAKHDFGSKQQPFVCDVCGKEYSQKHSLRVHLANAHSGEKSFCCDVCDKRFVFQSNLTRHQQMHKLVKRFSCDFCGKTFGQKTAMMNHRRNIHTGEKAFVCPVCGAGFKESSTFYRHKAACKM
ncbi:zinc finger protein 345-like [Topomyia yanbarensis]|uniref:zinc finger protein 345-like n=1 Tax=Topomyia yanbarensis TaxID=2498891 RepID=UPI00273C8E46|nr:zinc finger protein 345-like [Topomyia yanbarensis]